MDVQVTWHLTCRGPGTATHLTAYLADMAALKAITSNSQSLAFSRNPSLVSFFSTTVITLAKPAAAGDGLRITFDYTIARHQKNTGLAAMSLSLSPDRFYLFEGWTPTLAPFLDDQGYVGKVQKAPTTCVITVPRDFTGITVGSLTKTTVAGDTRSFHYDTGKTAPFLIPLLAGRFKHQHKADLPIPVDLYLTQAAGPATTTDFCRYLCRAAKYQTDLLGRRPPKALRLVLMPTGGLARGFPDLIIVPPYFLHMFRSPAISETLCHELSHTYFGNLVTAYGPGGNEFLSEGFATFMGVITAGHLDPTGRLEAQLFQNKKSRFFASDLQDTPLVNLRPMQNVLSGEAYNKGALILNELRRDLGHDTFQDILKTYMARHQNGFTQLQDFKQAAEDATGMMMDAFFDQYLESTRLPVITLKKFRCRKTGNTWTSTITLVNNGYGAGLAPVVLSGPDAKTGAQKKLPKNLAVPPRETKTFHVETPFQATDCILDPDDIFLNGVKRASLMKLAKDSRKKGNLPLAGKTFLKLVDFLPEDGEAWYNLGRVRQSQGLLEQACKDYAQAARFNKGTEWLPAWAWLRHADCLIKLGRPRQARPLLNKILTHWTDIYDVKKEARQRLQTIKEE